MLQRAATREATLAALAALEADADSVRPSLPRLPNPPHPSPDRVRWPGSRSHHAAWADGARLRQPARAQAASAAWLRLKLGDWLPRFEAPPRSQLAGLFLVELLSLSPTALPTADDRLEFVDPVQSTRLAALHRRPTAAPPPPHRCLTAASPRRPPRGRAHRPDGRTVSCATTVAYRILDQREAIARDWGDALAEATPGLLQSLLAADLEETLAEADSGTRDFDEYM